MKVRVALLLAAIAAAIVGGLVGWRLTGAVEIAITTAIAVYGAALATLGHVRSALADRADLQLEVMLDGLTDDELQVRLVNRGRRPAAVDAMGLWATESSEAQHYPYWLKDDPRNKELAIPATVLPDAPSVIAADWCSAIARWYVPHGPLRWIFVRPPDGRERWSELPSDIQQALEEAWKAAREQHARETQAHAADPDSVDDYGMPIHPGFERRSGRR